MMVGMQQHISGSGSSTSSEEFFEQQKFRQRWVWLLVLGSLAPVVGGVVYGFVQQIVFGVTFGDRPMSDGALIATTIGTLIFAALVIQLLRSCVLTTRVDAQGVHVRFAPFHRRERHMPFGEIATAEAVTYKPIADYGGWGLRCGPKGRAYNVSGNRGVLLTFGDGKTLLIGSRCADDLARAIRIHTRP